MIADEIADRHTPQVLAQRLPVAAVVRDVVGDPPHDPHAHMRSGEDWVTP